MNILAIDDEKSITELYEIFLESEGHTVKTLTDPKLAYETIKNESFDLIITDKKMPEISGIDIINYVEDEFPKIPIFLVTGDNMESVNFKNNKSSVLKKPISFDDFLNEVSKI